MTKRDYVSFAYQHRDEVLSAIDAGWWRHSEHLPKRDSGSINWWDEPTLEEIRRILAEKRDAAIATAERAARLHWGIERQIAEKRREEAEDHV